MSRSEEMGTLVAGVGCMFKCWWAHILKLLSFLWIGIATRSHEKYSDFFRNFFLNLQNGNCFSPEIGTQKASLLTFPNEKFSVSIFFPITCMWTKVDTTDSKPRTLRVWTSKNPKLQLWLRLLQCWLIIFR